MNSAFLPANSGAPALRMFTLFLAILSVHAVPLFSENRCDRLRTVYVSDSSSSAFSNPQDFPTWLVHKSEYDCALKAALDILSRDPNNWNAYFIAGLASSQLGDSPATTRYFDKALASAPEQRALRLSIGEIEERLGQTDNAEAVYRAGLLRFPHDRDLSKHLANLLQEQHRYRAAIQIWRHIQADDSEDTSVSISIMAALSDSGDQEAAIADAQEYLKKHPSSESAWYELGVAYCRQNNYSLALPALESAAQLAPNDSLVQLGLAKVYVTLMRFDEAAAVLQQYLKTHPDADEALFMLGRSEQHLGNLPSAEIALKAALKLNPDSYDAQYNLGVTLLQSGAFEDAIESLRKAAQLKPESAEPHFQLSRAYQRLNQKTLADRELQVTESMHKNEADRIRSEVLGNQGSQDLSAGRIDQAIMDYSAALQYDPDNAKLYYDLALAFRKKGNVSQELKALERAASDPALAEAHNLLGVLYMESDQFKKAKDEFSSALAMKPELSQALNNLGVLLAQEADYSAAERMLQRAIESDPSFVQAEVNLGLVLAGQGRLKEAMQAEDIALQMSASDPRAAAAKNKIKSALEGSTQIKTPF